MDEPWNKVLLKHQDDIVKSADPQNVFLIHLIDHLLAKRCIQHDQAQLVKYEPLLQARIHKLLDDVVSTTDLSFRMSVVE